MWTGSTVGGNRLAGGKSRVCPVSSNPVLRAMWIIRGEGEGFLITGMVW